MPSNLCLNNLVLLEMPFNKMQYLWNDGQDLCNLKHLDLSFSLSLSRCPDLSRAPKLELLILNGCRKLVEIPTFTPLKSLRTLDLSFCTILARCPDLSSATKLERLILRNCTNLVEIPTSSHLASLRTLDLSGCTKLKALPQIPVNVEWLHLDQSGIEELPSSIGNLTKLVRLNLQHCPRLKNIPRSICKLKSLKELTFPACSKWPVVLENTESSYFLELKETVMRELVSSIVFGLYNLTILALHDCGIMELPDSLGRLSCLQKLFLGSNKFESIPASIKDLSQLEFLDLSFCERLRFLPQLPSNVCEINAKCCTSLKALSGLPSVFTNSSGTCKFDFSNCRKLDGKKMIMKVIEEIELKGTTWCEEWYKKNYQEPGGGCIIVPGTEIPWWFKFQSGGSDFISFPVPPNGNRNVVCVVCIAMVVGLCMEGSYVCTINGKRVHASHICGSRIGHDHMIYDFIVLGYQNCTDGNQVRFELIDWNWKVQKFGVHLVYDQNFEESMKHLNSGFNHVGSFFKNK